MGSPKKGPALRSFAQQFADPAGKFLIQLELTRNSPVASDTLLNNVVIYC